MVGAQIVGGFAKEVTWGTAVSPATSTLLLTGNGITANPRNEYVQILANGKYPAARSNELVKQTFELSFMQHLFIDNVQALLEIATKRTSNILDSFTMYRKLSTVLTEAYAGCKCNRLNLRAQPDGLVEAAFDLIAKSLDSAASFTETAYPTGMPYKGARIGVTVDGVAAVGFRGMDLTLENGLNPGPAGSDFTIQDLDEGFAIWSGTLTAKFTTSAWRALVSTLTNSDVDTFAVVVTMANNTAASAKNLVLSFPTCRAVGDAIEGDQGTTVTQALEIVTEDALPTITYPS